jgi:hypothetical protein
MRWGMMENGHDLEVIEVYGMGEGVEELTLWCHTCDPEGKATQNYDMERYPKWRLAMAQARNDAHLHATGVSPFSEGLTSPA